MRRSEFIRFALAGSVGSALAPMPAMAAKTWKASLAQLPVLAETVDKGLLIDLLKAMAHASGDSIDITVSPFPRSIANVVERKADFHLPLLQVPNSPNSKEKFDYSSDVAWSVNFVLYSTKGAGINASNVAKARIETDTAHVEFFDFPIAPSSNLEASLKKVDAGRIDGLIFADINTDPILKSLGLKNVQRTLYKTLWVKFVLPKGGNGGPTDQFLGGVIRKMKASGEWAKVTAPMQRPYDDWQV